MLRSRERHCNVGSQPAASPISRILSGSIGSVVYVLTLTPLEVVKIRQQVATRPSAGGASAYSTTSKLQCCTPSTPLTFHPWRGALNNNCLMLPNTCSRRFESTAIHASTTHHDTFISSRRLLGRPARGIFSTLLSISRTEGRAGLYAGENILHVVSFIVSQLEKLEVYADLISILVFAAARLASYPTCSCAQYCNIFHSL